MLRAVVIVILLGLVGCASAPKSAVTFRPEQGGGTVYTVNGRIAVKYDGERSSANLHWTHRADRDDVLLLAPLGVTVAHIQRDAQGASMDASGRHFAARDSDELMQQVLGWHLPLSGLQYWMLALPRPDAVAKVEHNPFGQISQLTQDGWDIRYARYMAQTADSLPQFIVLQRPGLEIKLLVDEWEMP